MKHLGKSERKELGIINFVLLSQTGNIIFVMIISWYWSIVDKKTFYLLAKELK